MGLYAGKLVVPFQKPGSVVTHWTKSTASLGFFVWFETVQAAPPMAGVMAAGSSFHFIGAATPSWWSEVLYQELLSLPPKTPNIQAGPGIANRWSLETTLANSALK